MFFSYHKASLEFLYDENLKILPLSRISVFPQHARQAFYGEGEGKTRSTPPNFPFPFKRLPHGLRLAPPRGILHRNLVISCENPSSSLLQPQLLLPPESEFQPPILVLENLFLALVIYVCFIVSGKFLDRRRRAECGTTCTTEMECIPTCGDASCFKCTEKKICSPINCQTAVFGSRS